MDKNLCLKYLLASCLNLLLVEECLAQQTEICTVYSGPACNGTSFIFDSPRPITVGDCDWGAAANGYLSYNWGTNPCSGPPNNKQCTQYTQSNCTGTPSSYPTLSQGACFTQAQQWAQSMNVPFLSYTWGDIGCVEVPQTTKNQPLNNKSHPQAQKK